MKPKRSHYRFFVGPECILPSGRFALGDRDVIHQILKVFRLKEGDAITLLDDSGVEFTGVIDKSGPSIVEGVIAESVKGSSVGWEITLYFPFLKPDRTEFLLEKATELGVARLVPVFFERTQKKSSAPVKRWKKIIREAAEQSHRVRMPELHDAVELHDAIKSITGVILVADEAVGVDRCLMGLDIDCSGGVNVFIGPEGSFSDREKVSLQGIGAQFFSLGGQVLRSETAAVLSVGLLAHLWYNNPN